MVSVAHHKALIERSLDMGVETSIGLTSEAWPETITALPLQERVLPLRKRMVGSGNIGGFSMGASITSTSIDARV